jgi:hypothetical protein
MARGNNLYAHFAFSIDTAGEVNGGGYDDIIVGAWRSDYFPLPASPYYRPLEGVSARRDGEVVTVLWSPLQLRAGDDSGQYPYLIEAWVCVAGQLIFTPAGTYDFAAAIRDVTGWAEPSHGRVYGVE